MINKIKNFAIQMEMELDNNRTKGCIFEWDGTREKISELEYHKAKLLLAMKVRDEKAIKEYIADCANILLAIGNEYGLYDLTPSTSNTHSVLQVDILQEKIGIGISKPFLT